MQIKQKAKASVARSKKGAGRGREREGGMEVERGGTHSTHLYAVSFGFVFSFLSTAAHNAVNELRGQRSQRRRDEAEFEHGACCQLHLIEWTGGYTAVAGLGAGAESGTKTEGNLAMALPFFALANLNSCTNVRSCCHFLEPGTYPFADAGKVLKTKGVPLS